jgi:hypothetical protein
MPKSDKIIKKWRNLHNYTLTFGTLFIKFTILEDIV